MIATAIAKMVNIPMPRAPVAGKLLAEAVTPAGRIDGVYVAFAV